MANFSIAGIPTQLTFWAIFPIVLRFLFKQILGCLTRPCKHLCRRCFRGIDHQHGAIRLTEECRTLLSDDSVLSGSSCRREVLCDVTLPRRVGGTLVPFAERTGTLIPRGAVLFLTDSEDISQASHAVWFRAALDKSRLWELDTTWQSACELLGVDSCSLMIVAASRLILWHLLQPILYVLVFFEYYSEIDDVQQVLGWIVFAREACYVFVLVLLLYLRPVFLLVDPWALPAPDESHAESVCQELQERGYDVAAIAESPISRRLVYGYRTNTMITLFFILAPEKFVAAHLANLIEKTNKPLHDIITSVSTIGFFMMDSCAIAAIPVGVARHTLPLPLAVGYSLPILSNLCILWMLCKYLYFWRCQLRPFRVSR